MPGNKVEITAGYFGQTETPIFKGVIVRQRIEIDQTQSSKLIVEMRDEAIKMTLERQNALFENTKDSELITKLISRNGLQSDVAPTDTKHEEIVQYYSTDWDLMMTRAQVNSFVVMVAGGKVAVREPDTKQAPVLSVKYGDSILDLQAEMDAATQYAPSAIKSYTWDVASQQLIEAGPGTVSVEEPGNLSSADLAKVFKVKTFTQQTGGTIEKTSLQEWSSAELLKSKLSKIRGTVRFQGSAEAQIGKTIELAGVSERFNGKAFISSVHHHITGGTWQTTAEFGLSPQWFAANAPHLSAPDASGQLPPIKGLQTGIVKAVAKDPGGEFRVLVNLPILRDESKSVWARLGTFYASNRIGALFYPEIDDEVILGFMNEDPRYPVILGSVYSKKLPPPYTPEETNPQKAIVTQGKLEIYFNDADKVIQIKTPGHHLIEMNDTSGSISINASNNNTVSLSKDGVQVDSASNIKITAKKNISIQAGGVLKLSASQDASMEGRQVAHTAKTTFSAKGSTLVEVKSSNLLTINGKLVKIN